MKIVQIVKLIEDGIQLINDVTNDPIIQEDISRLQTDLASLVAALRAQEILEAQLKLITQEKNK